MLSNAYFLAKFRFDTAENGPTNKLQKFSKNRHRFAHNLQNELFRLPAEKRTCIVCGFRPMGNAARDRDRKESKAGLASPTFGKSNSIIYYFIIIILLKLY